ncbi:hypothetical protein HUN01_04970 [Nostoc edaphicum CCNP1411]|uniref:Uncharacterized protein n=1 Tax=Nostoc edaphicum CCNP1411 TaxID=1472755 RepID=A0A7D7L9E2_9NOSO|nr:hypothetical protein [Nostoc edaphicum]QMS86958.1 hypothetical protein HUN01_04970 [Nostoc edaphicum CCNP1411]
MTPEQPKPLIDLSHAKEPPRSINLDEDKEAAPLEPEEISGQTEDDPINNAFNRQEESAENVGNFANIPGASSLQLD